MGSLAMVDRGFRADAGIMTEPTGNRIAPLCHGILWGRIVIDGIGGHAELTPGAWHGSGPVDAVQLVRQVLDGIDILNRRWATDPVKRHPLMDLPNQITVTQIQAGEHPSSTAGRGEIVIDVQYLPAREGCRRSRRPCETSRWRRISSRSARPTPISDSTRRGSNGFSTRTALKCRQTIPSCRPSSSRPWMPVSHSVLSGFGAHSDIGLPTGLGRTPTVNFGPGRPSQSPPAQRKSRHQRPRRLHDRDCAHDRALVPVTHGKPIAAAKPFSAGCADRAASGPAQRCAAASRRPASVGRHDETIAANLDRSAVASLVSGMDVVPAGSTGTELGYGRRRSPDRATTRLGSASQSNMPGSSARRPDGSARVLGLEGDLVRDEWPGVDTVGVPRCRPMTVSLMVRPATSIIGGIGSAPQRISESVSAKARRSDSRETASASSPRTRTQLSCNGPVTTQVVLSSAPVLLIRPPRWSPCVDR